MANWILIEEQANINLMCDTLGVSPVLAQVMVNRHIRTKNTCRRFLTPSLNAMHDAFLMKDMEKAITLLTDCCSRNEKIVVYSDYDADGVMSAVILLKTLVAYGADISFYIPDREQEGYGLNMDAVGEMCEAGVSCMITCDNGIASAAEIAEAKRRGMTVIVLDHHEPPFNANHEDIIPAADAVINPKQSACAYPFKALCAAGISYKFAKAFHDYLELPFTLHDECLVLAMIATFCDIVDLLDENRVIASIGLDILNSRSDINPGLFALMTEKSCVGRQIDEFTIGFILGPCINATGRLQTAAMAVDLLTNDDPAECFQLAAQIVELNETRKKMTLDAFENAKAAAFETGLCDDPVMVIFDPGCHESIAGIVAGRLKETFHKPVLMLTVSGGMVKGSGRSIEAYNMFEGMSAHKDLFSRFGGHAMAVGVTLPAENVETLRERLIAGCGLREEHFTDNIKIDMALTLSDIHYRLAIELRSLRPFGKANKEPVFLSKGLRLTALRVIERKNTLIMTLSDGQRKADAVCFGQTARFIDELEAGLSERVFENVMAGRLGTTNLFMDIVYTIDINEYNGDVKVQLRIKDFRVNF